MSLDHFSAQRQPHPRAFDVEGRRAQALERQEDLKTRGVGTDAAVETAALALSAAEQAVLSRRQAEAQAAEDVAQAREEAAEDQPEDVAE